MKTVHLGDIMVSRRESLTPAHFPNEEFELFSIPAHDSGGFETKSGKDIGSSKQVVKPGDVLVSRIVPHIRRARVVGDSHGLRQIASGEWIAFRGTTFFPEYLRHYLLSDVFHRQFMNTVAGVGGSLLRARPTHVKKISLPLPPLGEQRRIAAILDQADAIRTKRRQQLTPLGELPGSLFWSNFSANYPIVRLEEVGIVQGGLQISRARAANPIEVPYLRVANVQRSNLDLSEIKLLRATDREITRTRLITGDLLFVEGHASQFEVGRVSLWNGELRECVHQNHLIRFRANRRRLEPRFAEIWFNTQRGATHFRRAARTTSGLHTISATTVKSAPLPLPPIEIQRAFVERVERINAQRSRVEAALACDDELFASLQSRAFKGEL